MSDALAVVEGFLGSLETKTIEDCATALGERVTDDFVWQNSGLPTQHGREAAQQFLLGFVQLIPMAGIRIETLAAAASGSVVVTERIDHLTDAAGNVLVSIPLAGTLEVRDGKISAWRDYFDPRPLLGG
jgi:limonene-1,2-epoxide hydrolase